MQQLHHISQNISHLYRLHNTGRLKTFTAFVFSMHHSKNRTQAHVITHWNPYRCPSNSPVIQAPTTPRLVLPPSALHRNRLRYIVILQMSLTSPCYSCCRLPAVCRRLTLTLWLGLTPLKMHCPRSLSSS